MANQNQKNLRIREVYDLLDKLCRKVSPNDHKEVLRKVTTTIAESQHGFFTNSHTDESILLAKIKNHFAGKSHSNLAIFLKLHEELSTLTQPKFRSSILTFLLCMSENTEAKLPNSFENRDFKSASGFYLPVRSNSIQTSASMEQIFRNTTSRVSFK